MYEVDDDARLLAYCVSTEIVFIQFSIKTQANFGELEICKSGMLANYHYHLCVAIILALLAACTECLQRHKLKLSPIILMPGYGGSKLEARWNKHYLRSARFPCERSTEWSTIWVDYARFLLPVVHCLSETMELSFDKQTGLTHNKPGLEIRVKEPHSVSSVEYLTDHTLLGYNYFGTLVSRLVGALGYKRNVNILGAPYDFRRAPNELGEYFDKLKGMSEKMFFQFKQPVTLICHSMGCLNALYFLQNQASSWKEKHIKRLISIAAPWGGSVKALRIVALGAQLPMPGYDPMLLSKLSRSFPSTFFLFPNEKVFGQQPLIMAHSDKADLLGGSEIFNAQNYTKFLDLVDHDYGLQVWEKTKVLLNDLKAPNVSTHCFYGIGQDTLARLQFSGHFPWSNEVQHFEDGDGTVTEQSGSYCSQWKEEQEAPLETRAFRTDHMEILKHNRMLTEIVKILKED